MSHRTQNIITFPTPANCNRNRLLNGIIRDGQLWLNERFLLSMLWLDKIPSNRIRAGDRQQLEHNGTTAVYVKEEVFWRVQWFEGIKSPHHDWLCDIATTNGKGSAALPPSKRRAIQKKRAMRKNEP